MPARAAGRRGAGLLRWAIRGAAAGIILLVLAIGCGSLFFSHVNDAGFWLVKEYFGLTVGETIKSWSVMETVISVFGFALVMLVSVLVT